MRIPVFPVAGSIDARLLYLAAVDKVCPRDLDLHRRKDGFVARVHQLRAAGWPLVNIRGDQWQLYRDRMYPSVRALEGTDGTDWLAQCAEYARGAA